MALTEYEKQPKSTEMEAIVPAVREFLSTLSTAEAIRNALAEGESILQIVMPLELPASLQATTLIYPLLRDAVPGVPALDGSPVEPLLAQAADLVQLGRFSLSADWEPGEALATQQSETLRKMLLSVVSDPRLMLVRIAEQLHRLREAKSKPVAEQRRLGIETREIYAPLANRLGVWQLKWELEDLAFRYLEKDRYHFIAKSLNEKRKEREKFIAATCSTLRAELDSEGVQAEVTGRPKHIYSIWRKMQRKEGGLEHIFDVRAVRIFVDDVADCYAALGLVHKLWPYLPGGWARPTVIGKRTRW